MFFGTHLDTQSQTHSTHMRRSQYLVRQCRAGKKEINKLYHKCRVKCYCKWHNAACVFVCWFDLDDSEAVRSSTTSSSSVSCSPDWIVYRDSRTHGARLNYAADTQQRCLDACAADPSCVSAQWDDDKWSRDECWLDDRHRLIESNDDDITLFVIVRRCKPTSGTWHQQVFFHTIYLFKN